MRFFVRLFFFIFTNLSEESIVSCLILGRFVDVNTSANKKFTHILNHFKMKHFLSFVAALSFILFGLSSCESVGEAQKYADSFYSAINSADYERALPMFSENLIAENGEDKILALMQQRNEAWGTIIDYSKYAFNTSTNNGVTYVVLKFKVESGKGLVYERLEFIQNGSDYKINGYFFNPDKSKIDEM